MQVEMHKQDQPPSSALDRTVHVRVLVRPHRGQPRKASSIEQIAAAAHEPVPTSPRRIDAAR